MEPECKVDFLTWYQANKITADRIINVNPAKRNVPLW